MNVVLPAPKEMPLRLYEMMLKRFQLELIHGFTDVSAGLDYWFTEEYEGRSFLRASFRFSYDHSVEGPYLEKVMAILKAQVERAGWYTNVYEDSLDVSEIDFALLRAKEDMDQAESDFDDEEEGVAIPESGDEFLDDDETESLDINGDVESETELGEDEEDDSEFGDMPNEEEPLEFEEDDGPITVAIAENALVEAIHALEEALLSTETNGLGYIEIKYDDAKSITVIIDGNLIPVEATIGITLGKPMLVYAVMDHDGELRQFPSVRAVLTFFKEVYGNDGE